MKANVARQDEEFDRELAELKDFEKCKVLVKQWLEERSQNHFWCWPVRKKVKWSIQLIFEKRQRMATLKIEDESMRKTLRGLNSRKLSKVKCTPKEVKEVFIVENVKKEWREKVPKEAI